MDYFGILKRAYEITIQNKYLWFFAILAGGAGSSFSASFPNTTSYSDNWEKYFTSSNQAQWGNFWATYGSIIVLISIVLLLLGFFLIILSIISQGALLGSVEAIEKSQPNNFRKGFSFGWHKFWRVFSVNLLLFLIILLSIIVLVLPIILFVLAKVYVLAIIYGLLFFLIDLILWLFLVVMSSYIQRLAVLGNQGAWEAILASWQFFKKNWKEILVIYLLLMAVGMAASVAILLVLLIVGGLLFAIGFALYLAFQFIFWLYVIIFGIALVILMLILGGVINTFNSTVLTLTYLELVKKA